MEGANFTEITVDSMPRIRSARLLGRMLTPAPSHALTPLWHPTSQTGTHPPFFFLFPSISLPLPIVLFLPFRFVLFPF
ncbi:hypothetical protein L209DRAFT_262290 [Thermothelomyces heterothallicus CBS 203.75]